MFKPTKPHHITNKAYVDANSGGGGGTGEPLIVNAISRSDEPTTVDLDKTFGEIWNAYTSGRVVVVNMGGDEFTRYHTATCLNYEVRPEGSYVQGDIQFTNMSFVAALQDAPYTEERLFAEYPSADFS